MDTLIATSADLAGDWAVIGRAEDVRAAVTAASNEIRSTRRLPLALLNKLHEAGLFRLPLPLFLERDRDRSPHFLPRHRDHRARRRIDRLVSQPGRGCAMPAASLDLPVAHAIFGNDPRAVLAEEI